ncbi:MAG: hypothetical protein Q9157_008634 [Trypethelium eluteriae]
MRLFSSSGSILLLLSLSPSLVASDRSVVRTFNNSIKYNFDTDGNAIDSTSGKIDILGGTYVWYGLNFGCGEAFCGISSWSSPDLHNWKSNGFLFDPNTTSISTLCAESGNCGRPHIIYNEVTREYVLWVNAGSPGYVLFTSRSPTSGYTQLIDRALIGTQPPGTQGGDFSVAVIDGIGYLAYSLIDFTTVGASIWPPFNQSIYMQQLAPDFLNTTGEAYHVLPTDDLVNYEAESPDIFKRGEYFYITASNTCGFCTGTVLVVYRSKSIRGPWERQIVSGYTCGGQTTGVLNLPAPYGKGMATYLHQADLFSTAPLTGIRTGAHGHQFQVLDFNTDSSVVDLDCSEDRTFSASFLRGNTSNPSGNAIFATDSSGELAAYTQECGIPTNALYQTWQSSSTGVLREVGFNLAGAPRTDAALAVTVFRFQENADFFTPHYVWETLATATYGAANLSQALEVRRITVGGNTTVRAGDRLGIALTGSEVTPLCYLVRDKGQGGFNIKTSTRALFTQGPGQVSFRGKNGNVPPVKVEAGKEIKWYATVE